MEATNLLFIIEPLRNSLSENGNDAEKCIS